MKRHPRPTQRCSIPLAGGLLPLAIFVSVAAEAQAPIDWNLIDQYCSECHNLDDYAGNIAFDLMDRDALLHDAETWELVIRKLRTGMMPPAGKPRPARAVMDGFTQTLGSALDAEYRANPHPQGVGLARLNREEYRNAVRDVLGFDASHIVANIPRESDGEGFDNNIDLLSVSPTLIEAYATAAMRIGREAVGDLTLVPSESTYSVGIPRKPSHVEGLPLGTRDGLTVEHYFPLDGKYQFSIDLRGTNFFTAGYCGGSFKVVVAIDGELIEVDDPKDFTLPISAGPHTIAAARQDLFHCVGAGDLFEEFSTEDTVTGIKINGPFEVTGAGETPSRRTIFAACYPQVDAEAKICAQEIFTRLATRAYRRPLDASSEEVADLMHFYAMGEEEGGFEMGIQYGIARMLMSPRFLYQVEEPPAGLAPGESYAINDIELASRLSFFLWSSIPDEELLQLAANGELNKPQVLEAQVRRMLRDPKAEALVRNFAGQWLKLRELDGVQPQDPSFNKQLIQAFRAETELLFADLINEDRGILSLLDSDYTWLNEQLAQHYGIEGVRGGYMRRVPLDENSPRRGILGHGSILTATSVANRTSPVVRGAWIVEDIMGAPVPTPPPGVETDLVDNADAAPEEASTLRERLELHRANPSCASCHQIMDPIGLALENFDLIGRWRTHENGTLLNTATQLMDGTPIDGPTTLRRALLARGDAVASNFIEKLLSYALGRHLHAPDMASVRAIAADTEGNGYRFSDIVLGIVESEPFRTNVVEASPAVAKAQ
jgi:Protein of unknown function (DUF1587)./Protein of unknown function (DUF1592)./Protein of unknown function (DUF1595)./Protein of unknown function (DUF1588)./Protein of unknown function (DUF1585).